MPIVLGTNDGVHRAPGPDGELECTLDTGVVRQVRRIGDDVFAATDEGLFRAGTGRDWADCGVPEPAAVAIAASPCGRHLYAGTRPAQVYVSADDGDSWERSESFASFPGRDAWENLGGVGPQVRAFLTHPDAPDRLVAGVEAAGVYVSPDQGKTWERRDYGLNPDVHDLTALDRDDWVAACGRGCYRTTDAGRSWQSLDTTTDQFWHTYHRETHVHDGVLYASAEDRAATRYDDDASGLLLASTDAGRTWKHQPFPGEEDAFVLSWATHDGMLLAGTSDGRVLVRDGDGWRPMLRPDTAVRSLSAWSA